MTESDVIAIIAEGFQTAILISLPTLVVALAVGLVIAFIQALTQIQEMTLTFVPKILAIAVTITLTLSYSYQLLEAYTQSLVRLMISQGAS